MLRISTLACRSSNHTSPESELGTGKGAAPHSAVERMLTALNHRGPDDRGIVSFEVRDSQFGIEIALGNTRLAVIDLSAAAHQPMQHEEAGLVITYNGEVYNFRELRTELGTEFGAWRSNSDTEVVLRAYRKWGKGCFERLRGMFALAIFDRARGELVLARDAFGIKPLYYSKIVRDFNHRGTEDVEKAQRVNGNFEISAFIFASEVRALLASELVPRKLDLRGLASYLKYGSVQAPLTIINEVHSLTPGNYLQISVVDGALQTKRQRYLCGSKSNVKGSTSEIKNSTPQTNNLDFGIWNSNGEVPRSRPDAVALMREKLEESVRAHLVSDVPLGVFLSGGMDSSALVALMDKAVGEPPKTFSVVFDERQFSEATQSRLIAKQYKTDHKEVRLTEERLLEMLPQAISSLDQPTMDGINTYVVSRAVKEAGITVALSGLGGDELFAGYPTFHRTLKMQSFSNFSKRLLRSASGLASHSPSASVQRKKFWQLAASDGTAEAVYEITRQLFASESIQRLMGNGCPERDAENCVPHEAKSASCNSQHEMPQDPVNAISCLELQGYMADTLLRDADCVSMAHSLEVRVPFLDVKVVPYVLSLPGNWKLNSFDRRRQKPLLADAVGDLLPDEVLRKPKMGFTLPFERWLQSRLREEISSVLENPSSASIAGLNPQEAALIWRRFLASPRSVGWARPWALYVLAKWCEINDVKCADQTPPALCIEG